jgi:NAD(P)-dependent dehydrogenase (short-subunit alcohol dehydrogenase family)
MPAIETRIALVTGAGTGIGQAAALALDGEGWTVVLAGRREGELQNTARMGSKRLLPVAADVSDEASVEALLATIRQRFGRLDLLFNNAGMGLPAMPLESIEYADWKRIVDVNLNGSFLCAKHAIRLMKAQSPRGGRIINNGSISAHAPRPLSAAYTATKHAITGLTRSLALDGRNDGITCGQIDIGNAGTPMTARMADGVLQADGRKAPEPTFDVKEVGRAILYMASLPPDANVLFMTVMANGMPFVGRG